MKQRNKEQMKIWVLPELTFYQGFCHSGPEELAPSDPLPGFCMTPLLWRHQT